MKRGIIKDAAPHIIQSVPDSFAAPGLPHPLIILSSILSSYAPALGCSTLGPDSHFHHLCSSCSGSLAPLPFPFDRFPLSLPRHELVRPGKSAGSSANDTCRGVLGAEDLRLAGVSGVAGFFREDCFGFEDEG